ncbi:hypothetical protein SAMN05444362_102231 [Dysgonomonas macrotermitis]|uniref:Uncharacterized protein n=2 Tax=Dysgonomonas macrotermitis TaxID=1346286 RepID=A0A1M4WI43_9BACT|nr:hypothetical protein SAMN05444362_102231 [Dysgonomonas macrotermitis]
MKIYMYFFLFFFTCSLSHAQVAIIKAGGTGSPAHPSAMLDMDFAENNKLGVSFPNISISGATTPSVVNGVTPAEYLIVFSPDNNDYYGYNIWYGNQWHTLLTESVLKTKLSEKGISYIGSAKLSSPQTSYNVASSSYILPINFVIGNGLTLSGNSYTIPSGGGIYNISCSSTLNLSSAGTGDIMVMVGSASVSSKAMTSFVAGTANYLTGSVTYSAVFTGGEVVQCAVSSSASFMVKEAIIQVTKTD